MSSVHKFLSYNLIDVSSKNAALAIQNTAKTVIGCEFESTDPDSDEVILSKILKVITKCVQIRAGYLLSQNLIYDMAHTCFKMSFQARSSLVLRKSAEMALIEIIQFAFSSYDLPEKIALEEDFKLKHGTLEQNEEPIHHEQNYQTIEKELHTNPRGVQFNSEDIEIDTTVSSGVSFPFGVNVLERLLQFFCSYINPRNTTSTIATRILSFNIINTIIEVRGKSLENENRLLRIIRFDLSKFLLQNLKSTDTFVLISTLKLCYNLFSILRYKLKFQLEIFMNTVFSLFGREDIQSENTANSKQRPHEQQERVLETIVQLCSDPDFIVDLYIGYDCDLGSSNLFEKLIEFLHRFSHPIHKGKNIVHSLHLIAMDGLISILRALESRLDLTKQPNVQELIQQSKISNTELNLKKKKKIKNVLLTGSELFNKNPKEGLEYLQKHGVLEVPLNPKNVAEFLKNNSFLSKTKIGEYLCNSKEFNIEVLKEYCKLFDYDESRSFIDTVRDFIESFRISGESQVIERVFDIYSEEMFKYRKKEFDTLDACYLICMSIIMLNVELHNPNVKSEKRMKLEQFIKNFKSHNGSREFPQEFLIEIYNSIKDNEIKVTEENENLTEITINSWKALIEKDNQQFLDPKDGSILEAARLGVYDELIFQVSWKQIHSGLKMIFIPSNETEVLGELISAFSIYGKLAASFESTVAFDTLIMTLCELSTILHSNNNSESFESKFSKDKKAQISARLMFTLIREYPNSLIESWKNITNCLIRLKKLELLPQINELDELLVKIESQSDMNQQSSNNIPFLSLVNNLLSWTTQSSDNDEKADEKTMKELCKNFFQECGIEEIVKQGALIKYLETLVK